MHEAFEHIPCNICHSDDTTVIYPSTLPQDLSLDLTKRFAPSQHAAGNDQIVRCNVCGLAYANPRIKQSYIWQGYSDAIDTKYATQGELRMSTFQRALRKIEHYLPQKGSILDVGCAAGFFLKVAKDAGWNAQGLEPNKGLAAFGRERYNIDITSTDLLSAPFPDSSFDAITFWDVLEHVADPQAHVKKAFQLLKKGGYVFVNYPDFGSSLAKLAKQKWWFLSPVHIYYFNRKTISRLLEQEGFTVVKHEKHWQTLELGFLFEKFADYSKLISSIGVKLTSILGLRHLPVRYYASQAIVIAKK